MTQRLNEVAPPGWGHTKADKPKGAKVGGTAHAMKLAQKRGDIPKNMNIFALMWSMKNKGDKPHYKPGVKDKLKGKYKGPEGQNEMIDPKKIRNYKNVSNAVVAKADKEAEKVKDKEQKGTLEFPQMPSESKSSHPGMQSHWVKTFKDAGAKRRGETRRRQEAQRDSPGQRIPPKPKKEEVTHFGDILRTAIEEAKKVDAIKEINKIVKTKTMGKLHGQKVDLFTASAIQQVYKAINHKNKEKMNSVMSKDVHGLLKMADFSMSKMKRR